MTESPKVTNGIKSYPVELALETEAFLLNLSQDMSVPLGLRLYAATILRGLQGG